MLRHLPQHPLPSPYGPISESLNRELSTFGELNQERMKKYGFPKASWLLHGVSVWQEASVQACVNRPVNPAGEKKVMVLKS